MPPAVRLTRAHVPAEARLTYFGRFVARGGELIAAGGAYGEPTLLCSTDGGRSFAAWPAPRTSGLRDMCLDGDTLWVGGEGGTVAATTDAGATWRYVQVTETRTCVYAIERDPRGGLWVAGEAGMLLRAADGERFERVAMRTRDNLFSIYFDPATGHAWLLGIATLRRRTARAFAEVKLPELRKRPSLAEMARTPAGSLVAVGRNGVALRSTDNGSTWESIAMPLRTDFEALAVTPYGIFVTGERLLVSHDDGRTFAVVETGPTTRLWALARIPGALVVGASDAIYRIDAGELAMLLHHAHAGRDDVLAGLARGVAAGDAELVLEDALRERGLW